MKLIIPFLVVSSTAFGSVTMNFDFSYFLNESNNAVLVGSKAVIVVDTLNDGFPQASDFFEKNLGATSFGTDNVVIGVLTAADSGLGGRGQLINGYSGAVNGLELTGGITSGKRIGLYFFPSVTSTTASLNGQSYGFYAGNSPTAVPTGSDTGFTIPNDGANVNVFAYSPAALVDAGFETNPLVDPTQANFTANLTVPIPEPSTYALMGLGLVVVGLIARRKKS